MNHFNHKVDAAQKYLNALEDAIFWHATFMKRMRDVRNLDKEEFSNLWEMKNLKALEAYEDRNESLKTARKYKDML